MCIYDNAKFSVLILHGDGSLVYQSKEETYDKDGPDIVEIVLSENLQNNTPYTVQINVSTSVNWTSLRFNFGNYYNNNIMIIMSEALLMYDYRNSQAAFF